MSETGKYNPELQAKIRKSVDGPIDSGRHDENETKKDEEYDSLDYEGKVKSLENELMKEWQTLRNIKVEKVQKYKLQDKNGEDVSVEDIADLAFDDDYNIDSNFLDSFDIKKEEEFAILTNVIHQEWAGLSVKDHKKLKRLERQNLRDHMSEAELIFTALAEMSTRQIAETIQAKGMPENKVAGLKGGRIAKKARLELEAKTGKRIVTPENYLPPEENKRMLDA